MAEELLGGAGHILEINAHINTKAPSWPTAPDGTGPGFGFHRGLLPDEGNHTKHGLFHSSFVKILTNLTDLGPEDGGTVVIAGSHKIVQRVPRGCRCVRCLRVEKYRHDNRALRHECKTPPRFQIVILTQLVVVKIRLDI